MTDRELIERLLFLAQTAVDQALDLNYDDPEDYFIYRELRELKAIVAAQPEPQGPTDEELDEFAIYWWGPETDARLVSDVIEWGGMAAFARAVLARWGRPAIEPVPQQEDVHYAWELHDAEGEWQAGGSANSLDDVQREGNRYLQTYSQDGPHKLIIERHCVTTIEPVPGVEGEP
jgi:hypothetical protein